MGKPKKKSFTTADKFQLGGAALTAAGGFLSDMTEAKLNYQNAQWLFDQADFIEQATVREHEIFAREGDQLIGAQKGAFATSGVEMSGSALDVINSTFDAITNELAAIDANGRMQMNEAILKGQQAQKQGDLLNSFGYQALRLGGSALTAYGGTL